MYVPAANADQGLMVGRDGGYAVAAIPRDRLLGTEACSGVGLGRAGKVWDEAPVMISCRCCSKRCCWEAGLIVVGGGGGCSGSGETGSFRPSRLGDMLRFLLSVSA